MGQGTSLRAYLLTRLALVIPMVLILLTIVFLLMRVAPQTFHLSERHRLISFVNQVKRPASPGPFACIAIKRNGGAAFRQHNSRVHAQRARKHHCRPA